MSLSPQVIAEILDVLNELGLTDWRFKRLILETGDSGKRSRDFASDSTKEIIDGVLDKAGNFDKKYKLTHRTLGMVIEGVSKLEGLPGDELLFKICNNSDKMTAKSVKYAKFETVERLRKLYLISLKEFRLLRNRNYHKERAKKNR